MNKLCVSSCLFFFTLISFANCHSHAITKQEIIAAQKAWSNGIVHIGKVYTNSGDYRQTAIDFINHYYAYSMGPVLFKPTKASAKPFRTTQAGALSYFVGGNKNFPEDNGFALQPWIHIRFKNVEFFIHGDYAIAMGEYLFTPQKGKTIEVEYTLGYIKDKNGNLKINVQHSSFPYKPVN